MEPHDCNIPGCENIVYPKRNKDKGQSQHCLPAWMYRDLTHYEGKFDEPLIDFDTETKIQSYTVIGVWCETCEKEFKRLDDIGKDMLSSRGRIPSLIKGFPLNKPTTKDLIIDRGRPFKVTTPSGIVSNNSHHLLDVTGVYECKTKLSKQLDLKKFLLSVVFRLQYHEDSQFSQHNGNKQIFYPANHDFYDVQILRLTGDPVINQIMMPPRIEKTNIGLNGENILENMGANFEIWWFFSGFEFCIVPKGGITSKMRKSLFLNNSFNNRVFVRKFEKTSWANKRENQS